MYNIAWYARDGHLDILPLISERLREKGIDIRSFYICNTKLEKEHLQSVYKIKKPWIIASYLENNLKTTDISSENIRLLEKKYNSLALIRSVWSTMFEQNLSEEMMTRYFISHIDSWREFLTRNKIQMFVGEAPSILSTCVAWMVCKNLQIDFVSFINLPIGHRISLTSSWEAYVDGIEEKLDNLKIDYHSVHYKKTLECIERMRARPEKTKEAQAYIDAVKKGEVRRSPIDLEKLLNIKKFWKRYQKRKEYYMYSTFSKQISNMVKFYINSQYYKLANIFKTEKDLGSKRFFLFPLHMQREWADYTWMGLSYADQPTTVRQVAACLPLGCELYVKEHTAYFGEKTRSFYRKIKEDRRIKLLHPYVDTFRLIRSARGIVTLGSTVGFEAFLMGKPVIILGNPWYRNLPGVYRADNPEILAELLQNVDQLSTANEEEKMRVVYALHDLSFDGVRYPHPDVSKPKNIEQFTIAFEERIARNTMRHS